jgi:hypothetical protein
VSYVLHAIFLIADCLDDLDFVVKRTNVDVEVPVGHTQGTIFTLDVTIDASPLDVTDRILSPSFLHHMFHRGG